MTNEKNDSLGERKDLKGLKKKARAGIAAISFFIAIFDNLATFIYDALIDGFFGKIFTSYSNLQEKFERGLFGKGLLQKHRLRMFFRRVRQIAASAIDSCFFVSKMQRAVNYFCSAPLHFYGNFTMFFGIYTIVVYFVKMFILGIGAADTDYLIIGAAVIIASIPLLLSKVSLVFALKNSVISKMVLQGAFGLPDETFDSKDVKVKGGGNYMLFLGLLAGSVTIFVHPLLIFCIIFAIVIVALIASSPEIGVLLTIVTLPFLSLLDMPTLWLCVLICVTFFFYMIKLIRGKRVFRLELLDVFIVLFGVAVILCSIFSAGGVDSIKSALVTVILLLGYFLLVNLMRTEMWVKRCVLGFIGSATVVAFIGIFEYFFGESNGNWLDLSLFSNIRLRVVSLFENPNILSTFLVLIFPFVLAIFCLAHKKNEKILILFVGMAFVACTIFTWSRGAWIAMMTSTLIFFLMYTRKTFRVFGAALILVPALPIILPDTVVNRLLSVVNLSDSSISYRIYTWKGSIEAIKDYFFTGIGYGSEAFKNIYPYYAYAGIEAAEHSHSLFLQIFLYMGIFGVIIFGMVIFSSLQKFFEYIKTPENRTSKVFVIATVASVIAGLIMGVFDYIWYNYRVFYVFWVVIAIGCAFVRIGDCELKRKETYKYLE